jgi:hypothetical protein
MSVTCGQRPTVSSRRRRGGTRGTPGVKPPSHQNTNVLSTQHTSSATPCSAKNFCTGISHSIALQNWRNQLYAGDQTMDSALCDRPWVRSEGVCCNGCLQHQCNANVAVLWGMQLRM